MSPTYYPYEFLSSRIIINNNDPEDKTLFKRVLTIEKNTMLFLEKNNKRKIPKSVIEEYTRLILSLQGASLWKLEEEQHLLSPPF